MLCILVNLSINSSNTTSEILLLQPRLQTICSESNKANAFSRIYTSDDETHFWQRKKIFISCAVSFEVERKNLNSISLFNLEQKSNHTPFLIEIYQ